VTSRRRRLGGVEAFMLGRTASPGIPFASTEVVVIKTFRIDPNANPSIVFNQTAPNDVRTLMDGMKLARIAAATH
jgi:hypothetical protein